MRSKLRDNERLIYVARKHWIVLVKPIVLFLLFIALSVIFSTSIFLYVAAVMFVYLVYCIYDRKYNIWIVTNKRVIDEWGILSHKFKESPIEKINNVNVIQDVAGRFLNYGSVEIQTAAEQGKTVANMVQNPKKLQEAILTVSSQNVSAADDLVECYYCAELIKKNAKICRYCGREVVGKKVSQESNIYNDADTKNNIDNSNITSIGRKVNIYWKKEKIE